MKAVAFLLLLGLAAATRCREGGQEGQEGQEDPSDSSEMAPEDLARPRIVLVGQTGSGKSSLANSLLGVNPQEDSVIFPVGTKMGSCTKSTKAGTGPWLGTGQNFTVVDTPGFGDADGEMPELIDEMLDVLKNQVKSADLIVLLIKGSENRFNEGLQKMLTQMSAIFGKQWWEYMIIGVSFWEYSQFFIDRRGMDCPGGQFCNDESWFHSEIQGQLKEKFNLNRNFSIVFAHSHSQTKRGREDPLQQKYWVEETQKIWDFANSKNTTFQFKDVDDILVENTRLKREVSRLNEFIDSNLTEIKAALEMVNSDVHRNEVLQIAAVEKVQSDVDRKFADLTIAPLGTITAWVTKPAARGVPTDLPPGWVRCDGSTIPRPSIWAGQLTPDLNHQKRFLRGGGDGDQLTMEDDTTRMSDHVHIDHGHRHSATSNAPDHSHTATSTAKDHSHGYSDRYYKHDGSGLCGGSYWGFPERDMSRTTAKEKVDVKTVVGKSSISVSTYVNSAKTGLSGVSDLGSFDDETKPKNMNVIYIIKVW